MVGFAKKPGGQRMKYIALDCHKRYSFARIEDETGRVLWEGRFPIGGVSFLSS